MLFAEPLQTYCGYEILGILVMLTGLLIVGSASLATKAAGDSQGSGSSTTGMKAIGIVVLIVGQAIHASQAVVEEMLLNDVQADPYFIVACEGFWGVILVLSVFIPLAMVLPGEEGNGIREDFHEAVYMFLHSRFLQVLCAVSIIVMMIKNIVGMILTQVTHATTRSVIESPRPVLVWLVTVVIYYAGVPAYGEELGHYSHIQAIGCILLVLGMLIYNKVVRLSCASLYPSQTSCPEQPLNISLRTLEET